MSFFDDTMSEAVLPQMFDLRGEAVTYYPRNGPQRTVTVLPYHTATDDQMSRRDTDLETFAFTCLRDPDDASFSGIGQPDLRDELKRASDPADAERYRYHHTEKSSTAAWRLVFQRRKTKTTNARSA